MPTGSKAPRRLGDYLTVGQAAELLGVSIYTLRYWDRTDRLKPFRHPVSRYRLYKRETLVALLEQTASGDGDRGTA